MTFKLKMTLFFGGGGQLSAVVSKYFLMLMILLVPGSNVEDTETRARVSQPVAGR